jgi:hypothetical protein
MHYTPCTLTICCYNNTSTKLKINLILPGCGATKADIIFLLDSSGSEGRTNFGKQKDFVTSLVNTFTIGHTAFQVGVVTFSSGTHPEFTLRTYTTKSSLIHGIAAITYQSGITNTGPALDYVRQHSFTSAAGDRTDAPNVLIVMTDGKSTVASATLTASGLIHRAGIKTSAIGIGISVSHTELSAIATDSHHVFTVSSFDALHTIQAQVSATTCKYTCMHTSVYIFGR